MLFKNVGLKWNLGIEKDTLTQKISPVYQLGTIEPSFNRSIDNFDCFSLKVHEIEIFFGFDFEISLRFYLVSFASKRNKAK
jgi:hypothetical protein